MRRTTKSYPPKTVAFTQISPQMLVKKAGFLVITSLILSACNNANPLAKSDNSANSANNSATKTSNTTVTTTTSSTTVTTASNLAPTSATAVSASAVSSTSATAMTATPKVFRQNVSQQFVGTDEVSTRLATALPEIPYTTDNLSSYALEVNQATWQAGKPLTAPVTTKIQALLNWHHFGVGAVDGVFTQNTRKAMQAFQQANNLPITQEMNEATWQALTVDPQLANQPVLVNYSLVKEDVLLPTDEYGMQYHSIKEGLGEKFHMSRGLITALNPKTPLKVGQVITVYNPGQPNEIPVAKVIADKKRNILWAYDAQDKLIATYPTTVGSRATPSPKGIHHVINRVINPTYNKDFSNTDGLLPPGPNNPVGRVWMGLDKKSYGIHGSPEPEMISRQGSHGCVRLTNWDALSLYGTMQNRATVEFKS